MGSGATGIVGFVKPICDYIDGLVHPSARQDALAAARHRAFIAPRLLGSLIALAAFPVYLLMRGVPGTLEIAVLAWLVLPILIAFYLSRTGRYEAAHALSSLALTGLVAAIAFETGGLSSFAAVWLVIVPLEAALSASRRVVMLAAAFAIAAAGGLLLAQGADLLPVPDTSAGAQGALAALGVISASLYATGLALGSESLARTGVSMLSAEEDRYRLLACNMADAITRHGRHGAVLFASPAAEPLFGAPAGALLGHGLFDRVHVGDRPAYLTAIADAAALGEARSVEFRVRRGDAPVAQPSHLWIEMRCRPLVRPGMSATEEPEVVAVMRDVSARKLQEQALCDARTEAERADAAKTRFLATMSHELRTPLNAIIGFSEMLANETAMRLDVARRVEYAKLINDSGQHLLSVVNGILDMSKMETGDFEITPEPFAPTQVIRNCCDILALRARDAKIDLATEIEDDLPDIVADKRALKQIMLNLLSNAIKFTNPGGRVCVQARADRAKLSITVEDNGIGIGAADLSQLGDPFFQARSAYDRRHDGTGLGLSIVKGLIALHGGDFAVKSELGRGTRMTVSLPLDCESKRPVRLAPRRARVPSAPETSSDQVRKSA